MTHSLSACFHHQSRFPFLIIDMSGGATAIYLDQRCLGRTRQHALCYQHCHRRAQTKVLCDSMQWDQVHLGSYLGSLSFHTTDVAAAFSSKRTTAKASFGLSASICGKPCACASVCVLAAVMPVVGKVCGRRRAVRQLPRGGCAMTYILQD